MTTSFRYKAVDAKGSARKGVLQADSEQDAFRKLSASGLTPTEMREAGKPNVRRGVSQNDVASLARELSVLLEARIPIGRGLLAIAEYEPKPALREMVRDVAAQIESGSPLTTALGKYRHAFGEVFLETVRSAEQSGTLYEAMDHLADMLERQIETKRALTRALAYPVIVLAVVSLALSVIVVFVVPRFAETFQGQGMELPLFTQVVKNLGESVRSFWWAYGMGALGLGLALTSLWKSPSGRLGYERLFLRLPYIRSMIRAVAAARFARVFGLSLGAGVDMVQSLEMAGRSTGRPLFVTETKGMADRVRKGDAVASVMHESDTLPGFARRMMAAGKDSTELSRACTIVARHYDRQSDHLMKNIGTLIEPVMTVLMAAVVLVIALSVFLPMWQMMGAGR